MIDATIDGAPEAKPTAPLASADMQPLLRSVRFTLVQRLNELEQRVAELTHERNEAGRQLDDVRAQLMAIELALAPAGVAGTPAPA